MGALCRLYGFLFHFRLKKKRQTKLEGIHRTATWTLVLEAFLFLAHLTVLYMFCTVHNVICEFGTCIVMSLNRTLVKDKMRTCKGECAQFSFSKCPIDSHGGAGAEI